MATATIDTPTVHAIIIEVLSPLVLSWRSMTRFVVSDVGSRVLSNVSAVNSEVGSKVSKFSVGSRVGSGGGVREGWKVGNIVGVRVGGGIDGVTVGKKVGAQELDPSALLYDIPAGISPPYASVQ
jgi:hypothetical protein